MIEIINNCPVCGSSGVLKFKESDRGDDLPEEGAWSVPCGDCQKRLAEQVERIHGQEGDAVYVNLLFGCQRGCDGCLSIAKHLIDASYAVDHKPVLQEA